ncbi:MAG: hypothetical protein BWX48_03049 [Verrucomicrobia bacterium ADurb.Bin006]|nr:MAG: hypothetical protein BWX48_03049 [Verrucomicrobia bacterium ADurb.Bin006]
MVFKRLGKKVVWSALSGYTLYLLLGTLAPFDFTLAAVAWLRTENRSSRFHSAMSAPSVDTILRTRH